MSKESQRNNLQETEPEKDHGMHIDPLLNFSAHCDNEVNKGNKILGMIRRCYRYPDQISLAKLCTSLVTPHLEYVNNVSASV